MMTVKNIFERISPQYNISFLVTAVSQKQEEFYVGQINAEDLISIATVDVRTSPNDDYDYITEIEEKLRYELKVNNSNLIRYRTTQSGNGGIQRLVQVNKLKSIAKYIRKPDSLFANSIIVSLSNKKIRELFGQDEILIFKKFLELDDATLKQEMLGFTREENETYQLIKSLFYGRKEIDIEELEELETNGFDIKLILVDEKNRIFKIQVDHKLVDAFVIDGQHRLAAFALAPEEIKKYQLPITLFTNLIQSKQAELFKIINGEQKPVNKSLIYDLAGFGADEDIIKKCNSIAAAFNEVEASPFKSKIKMIGTDSGTLSQAAFVDELKKYLGERKSNSHRAFLSKMDKTRVLEILFEYFSAIQNEYKAQWDNKDDYVVTRTTGFGIMIKLLYYVYIYSRVNQIEFNQEYLKSIMKTVKSVTNFSSAEFEGGSSQGIQASKRNQILRKLYIDDSDFSESKYKLDHQYRDKIDKKLEGKLSEMDERYKAMFIAGIY